MALSYNLGKDVEAFSTMIDEVLPYPVVQAHQTHTDRIAIITDPATTREQLEGIDAMITNVRGCAIGARTADCVPVLLYDPIKKVVAAIHSGWKGTVLHISQKTIRKMQETFGCAPSDLHAVIGPSISMDAFQVGEEVVEAFAKAGFPMDIIYEHRPSNYISPNLTLANMNAQIITGHHIGLWKANAWLLQEIGVKESNIQVAGICSYTNHDRFYSARWEKNNKTKRTINAIVMV